MKKKIKKRLYILGLIAIVVITISFSGFLIVSFWDPFKIYDPSFKQVTFFSRPVKFLNFVMASYNPDSRVSWGYIGYLGKSRGDKLILKQITDRPLWKIHWGIIGVRPDNKSFFVSVYNKLVEIDSNLNVIREIPIRDFNFEPNDSNVEFTDFGAATNNTLWFGINRIKSTGENTRELETSLIKWDFDKNPSTRIEVDAQAIEGITLDEAGGKIFGYGYSNLIFDLNTMTKKENRYYIGFCDFNPNYGLLISKTKQASPSEIIKIDIFSGKETVIGEGLSAIWGYDGDVFYFDARKRLCRCSADGNNVKIITSGFLWKTSTYPLLPPKISRDRTLLAYSINPIKGTLLLDIKTHEYIIIKDNTFNTNEMAWLVKE